MPSATEAVKVMDAALRPHGFHRKSKTWTRRASDVHHVIDVQVSKSADTATINVGVFDSDVHEACWGEAAKSITEPCAVFRTRIGHLIGDRDIWWPLGSGEDAALMAKTSLEAALPFLDRISDRKALLVEMTDAQNMPSQKFAQDTPSRKLRSIQIAILMAFDGRLGEAKDRLEDLESDGGPWALRAAEVRTRLTAKFG
ncbi:MAG: DUF4304 domain-containing protein [Caulobacter sp.]|nr:DUF4304 domain-containing protein [Caulobacter sp.]